MKVPQCVRPGLLIPAAVVALIAEAAIVVSVPGTEDPRPVRFSLVATDEDGPPPENNPPVAAPPQNNVPPPVQNEPPVAPPPQLRFWFGGGSPRGIPAFVQITNNSATVNCSYHAVAVAGPAQAVNFVSDRSLTVTGSAETRLDLPGPETGSTWHATVTCDNGLSAEQDQVY